MSVSHLQRAPNRKLKWDTTSAPPLREALGNVKKIETTLCAASEYI